MKKHYRSELSEFSGSKIFYFQQITNISDNIFGETYVQGGDDVSKVVKS